MINPCVKRTYITKSTADNALVRIMRKNKKSKSNKRFKLKRSYQCKQCGFWRLTSQK